jgi:preprotein translocase subunit SecG
MELVILSIHLLVCVCLIGLVLLQRSEGGALGMGGGTGSLMSGRGAADALARMTSVAGGFFLVTSLGLTMLSGADAASQGGSVFDRAPAERAAPAIPAPAPAEQRPDPTESSLPADTQLASLSPSEASAATPPPVAPAPVQAAARAAPLETSAPARTQPASTRPATQPTTRPAATTTQSTQPTAQPASARTTVPVTQQRPAATTTTQRPAAAPTTTANGAVSGITLTDTSTESPENTLETPRRERAGPDQ